MDGDSLSFATSGAVAIGVLTAWLWVAGSAMAKVWVLQRRGGPVTREGWEDDP